MDNDESIGSSDRGYTSIDPEPQGPGGISTQLAPEFSRKLSFVEHHDDDDAHNNRQGSDSHLGAQMSASTHTARKASPVFGPTLGAQMSASTHSVGKASPTCDPMLGAHMSAGTHSARKASPVCDPTPAAAPREHQQAFLCSCGDSFEKSVHLAAHRRWTCRFKDKTAQCHVCQNWFASDMGLKRHMKHAHGGVYSCDSCSLRFPNKIKLTRHWMEAHYDERADKEKTLKCFECGDTNFENRFELECHLVLHKFEKHQQKMAEGVSASHQSHIHFSPYPSPPFMRPMRPHHPFHHPYGFGPPWSHFPFRPPPPSMFPFMPFPPCVPFRPPFPPPPFRSQFPAGPFSPGQEDGPSVKSFTTSTAYGTASSRTDDCSPGAAAPAAQVPSRSPHHNHEYVEPTAFPCLFHHSYDCTHTKCHHHNHHEHQQKKKWKKYLKLMLKGKVPSRLSGLLPPKDEKSQERTDSCGKEKDANICEFKMACKFCDKIIETNTVLWHQKKECPVLATHQCGVCDRVFKKRHFLIRHMHEQNHLSVGTNAAAPGSVSSNCVTSLQEKMNASLQLLNVSGEVDTAASKDVVRDASLLCPKNVSCDIAASQQVSGSKNFCENIVCAENRGAGSYLPERAARDSLQCHTCRYVCQSIEDLSEHLKEHISQVLAVQKVREWTTKSSEYFFLGHPEDDDEIEGAGSLFTATTSYFDSEITSTASSAVQDLGSTFSSLDTTGSRDPTWTKPHKKRSKHRHKGEITVCEFCGEKFAFRKDLHYHMETSHKDSTLECPVCKKKFSWKKRGKFYERHLNSHYGVKIFKHKCDACGKTFLENSKLRAHMSLHNSELLHKCAVCGKGYANKSSLVRHERKHTGVKPYQCDVCQESFMEKRELLRHSTTHTGVAPFNCEDCGQGFTLKTSLMSHYKKKHSLKEKLQE
ncbi:unnamed protein product [Candidula unifasciata]|uniref:C2H2-type domain-containing protein n=1 Tax=Candidula unifasciata TaxID=100452 RepID=A0A8S3YL12_9EUPU|nr:unnamed protein product [Candidula unifasciata]